MIAAVADTHAIVWYLLGDARLSAKARKTIDEAANAAQKIAISAITLAELIYLIEKNRLHHGILARLVRALEEEELFVEAPFNAAVAQAMRAVSRVEVPDLPDRIIAATAVFLKVPVLSRDRKIAASSVATIW